MAIYITGDTHGEFARFTEEFFPEQAGMTKADCVMICGDFGGVWDGSEEEESWLDWLETRPFTTLFISGNHENFDRLAQYPVEQWNGGEVQLIRPSVIHLTRGQVFHIQGLTFFTMGGARSYDITKEILDPDEPGFNHRRKLLEIKGIAYRVKHHSWWPEEMPSHQEYQAALDNLEACSWKVDYVVTHCCPTSLLQSVSDRPRRPDQLTDFLEEVAQRCQFKYWFFGHYHDNGVIREKFVLLYEQILRLKV